MRSALSHVLASLTPNVHAAKRRSMRSVAPAAAFAIASLGASDALAGPITFPATDGATVHAEAYGSGERGVILVHGETRTRADWDSVAKGLAKAGFHVVALDLRGHGATPGALDEAGYAAMVHDVAGATAWMAGKGSKELAVMGADLGGTVGLAAAAEDPRLQRAVLVSPRLSAQGYRTSAALEGYGERPLLMIVGSDDDTGSRAAGLLEKRAKGRVKVHASDRPGTGHQLFARSATLEGMVVSWLGTDHKREAAREAGFRPAEVDDVKTTGKRIGED